MGLRMNGECPTSGTADPLPCSMPMPLPFDERARGVSISTKCFKEMHEIGGSSLYEYQTAQGKAFLTIPLSLMSLCVWTPACTGRVTVRTIRPLTAKARTTLKQLQQPLVQPSSFSQEHISTVNNIRPGSLLLASLGDSKVNSKQHPAITGFSVSNPPLAVNAIRITAVAEVQSTPIEAIGNGLIATVEAATGVKGLTARRLAGTARTTWTDPDNPSIRVMAADWEVQGPGGQEFVMRAMEPSAVIQVPSYDPVSRRFGPARTTIRPAPQTTHQMEVGRGMEYSVECTVGGKEMDEDAVKEFLTQAARFIFTAETEGQTYDSPLPTPEGVATAMTVMGMHVMQLLGVEAAYKYSRQRTVKITHGHVLAASFIEEVGGLDIRVMDVGMALTPVAKGPWQGPMGGSLLRQAVELGGFPTGSILGDPSSQQVVLHLMQQRVDQCLLLAQEDPVQMGFPSPPLGPHCPPGARST